MNKKTLIFLIVFLVALVGAVVKMVTGGTFQVFPIIGSVLCAAYGIKRLMDDSVIGEIVMSLCILLMIFIIFEIKL